MNFCYRFLQEMTSLFDMTMRLYLFKNILNLNLVFLSILHICASEYLGNDMTSPRVLGQLLVNASDIPCGSVNLQSERLVCVVNSPDDVRHLLCPYGHKNCDTPPITCKDGSLKKTCYPVGDGVMTYSCVCHSYITADAVTPPLSWSVWQIQSGTRFPSTRHLLVDNDPYDAIVEYSAATYIITTYGLIPQDVYSASTEQVGNHQAYRASLNVIPGGACAWLPNEVQTPHWLQMSFPGMKLGVKGLIMKQRCDNSYKNQYVREITVKRSIDGASWRDVIVNEDIYPGQCIEI